MSACNTFTEHVWKPGECKNCFKPKSLHRLAEAGLKNGPPERPTQLQSLTPVAGRPSSYLRSSVAGRSGHFRPPVAKKPTIAVKPTMMLSCSSAVLDSEGNRVPVDIGETGKGSEYAAWNRSRANLKRPGGVNNNEGEDEADELEVYSPRGCRAASGSNNNGLTDVLKEIAGLGSGPGSSSGSSSRDLFLGRISSSYKRSLERGLPASSCLAVGSSRGGAAHKHVSLNDSTEVISTEGGRFCYPEFSSDGEEEEDESEGDDGGEHESWDESDEELLAMEIRMRGQPRFANFRAATLSPVPFAAGKKWNTVPLRNRSLQRICAVDYDDSYDEILNGYPSVDSNGGLIPFGQNDLQGSGFFSNSESTTSPESSSSLPEDSRTTTSSSTSSAPSNLPNGVYSPPASRELVSESTVQKEPVQHVLRSPKASETHKAILAIRLEERDGSQKEGGPFPQALPGQPVTISFSPTDEQAKPYRVVSLEKPPICKPYTVVDVSASMTHTEEHPTNSTPKPKGSSVSSTPAASPSSPMGLPSSSVSPVSPSCVVSAAPQSSSRKKASNIRYQEVWTSSTSPRQKIPKVELVGGAASGPTIPPRHCSHKSAPTSPTAGLSSSSRTVPVKSPNLSEIKFNSYNNAGMPPFPIIIRDEPTYARGSKNAVKVPIVINPSAYDNLAVYKSFLGLSGEIPPTKTGGSGRVASHTYEEIGSSESIQSSPTEPCANGSITTERVSAEKRKASQATQKVQEVCTDSSTATCTAAVSSSSPAQTQTGSLTKGGRVAVSPGRCVRGSGGTASGIEGGGEHQPPAGAGSGSVHREKASAVLSQIVASIQPPQSPPESPSAQSKTCSVEELYALPPDATRDTLSRPKSLFSTTDGCLSKPRKEGPSKQLPKSQSASAAVPPVSPRSEPSAPFPPPRSTSSPYHAANLLQKHFGNWAKVAVGSPRTGEAETSPGGAEGRRVGTENTKPKRWISFKSFFRRRKDEDEQRERVEREKEKGKLVGLDGTVIHMLPPPPIQRHHWFTEAKPDDPSQKPTIIFTYKPGADEGEEGEQLQVEELRERVGVQLDHEQAGKQSSGTTPVTEDSSLTPGLGTEGTVPVAAPLPARLELPLSVEPPSNVDPNPSSESRASLGGAEEEGSQSHSPASSTCSATYSNLGQSRANMIPLKQPRNPNPKASDDTVTTAEPEGPESGPKATPPPLPKKSVARANTEPSTLAKELLSLRPKGEAKPGGTNLSVANPLYDLDSTWETASQSSSMGSEARPPDQESGDSLERPGASKGRPATSLSCLTSPVGSSTGRQSRRGCRSAESLAGRGRGGALKAQRTALYKGVDNWEEVVGRIRGLHTDTLRKLASRCEDRFMGGQKDPLRFDTDSWSDFRLTTGRPCCEAGDAVYYTASYAKDPLVNYAIKICRSQIKETQQQLFHSLAIRQSLALHFNIQQDCGHFLADVPLRLLPWEEDVKEEEEDEEKREEETERKESNEREARSKKWKEMAGEASQPGQRGQVEGEPGQPRNVGTTGRLRSRVVVITREVPFQTVADFVQEGAERHARNPELYERQVCLLLLQLCQGLEHMKPYHVTHCDLRMENLLLVQCQRGSPWNLDVPEPNNNSVAGSASGVCPARLIISNFSQAKQKSPLSEPGTLRDQARLAPEIVTATQYRKCDEFQTGILIYEMLHRPNPFEETPELKETEYTCADLPSLPVRSLYSRGLRRLTSLLLNANPSERIQIADARACLQCLLWGPREDLFQALGACSGPAHRDATLQNWLDLKRTLMMIKFAERSLDTGCGVSLEDWLCCQYLAFATTDTLARVVRILQPIQPQPL